MTLILRSSVLAFALAMLSVSAQAVVSIKPEFQNIEFKARQKISGAIEVANNGAQEVKVQVQPEDWTDKGHIQRGVSWIKIKPEVFILKPGMAQKVSFTARIPKDAQAQYITQIFFAASAVRHTDMNIGVRIASLIHWKRKQK